MKNDIKDRVKSYEDACQVLGEQPIVDFGDATPDEIAYKKLKTVVEALNDGWTPDYRDSKQEKWYPWFYVSSSGFSFKESNYCCVYPNAGITAHLCFNNEELADYAGEQFLDLWEGFIL